MAHTEVTNHHEHGWGPPRPRMIGDLMIGDVVEVGGFPEKVCSVTALGDGLVCVRTDGSVLVRPQQHELEVWR